MRDPLANTVRRKTARGGVVFVVPWALVIDQAGLLWINPNAFASSSAGSPYDVRIECFVHGASEWWIVQGPWEDPRQTGLTKVRDGRLMDYIRVDEYRSPSYVAPELPEADMRGTNQPPGRGWGWFRRPAPEPKVDRPSDYGRDEDLPMPSVGYPVPLDGGYLPFDDQAVDRRPTEPLPFTTLGEMEVGAVGYVWRTEALPVDAGGEVPASCNPHARVFAEPVTGMVFAQVTRPGVVEIGAVPINLESPLGSRPYDAELSYPDSPSPGHQEGIG